MPRAVAWPGSGLRGGGGGRGGLWPRGLIPFAKLPPGLGAQAAQGKAGPGHSCIPSIWICKSKGLIQAGPWATGVQSDSVILQAPVGLAWMDVGCQGGGRKGSAAGRQEPGASERGWPGALGSLRGD